MEYKVCSKCGKELLISEFVNSSGSILKQCKQCREKGRIEAAKYRKYHPEKIKERRIKYTETHRDEILQKSKAYYWSNREDVLERQKTNIKRREYRIAHREKINDYSSKWQKEHRELANKRSREYRVRNKDRYLELNRASINRRTRELRDAYIRQTLIQGGFNPQDITPDLIMLKRASIQLNRAINNSKE